MKKTVEFIKWNIYYCDREYAREMGDPILGVVEAANKAEAERKADCIYGGVGGVWAVPQKQED